MISKPVYKKLLIAAYVFYIGIALSWFLTSFFVGGYINYVALASCAVFCAQAYYKHRVANLILGILILAASIFGLLFFLSWGYKSKGGFDAFINVMSALAGTSILLSIFLVFSYLKLSFEKE